jgi:hypothetical protein
MPPLYPPFPSVLHCFSPPLLPLPQHIDLRPVRRRDVGAEAGEPRRGLLTAVRLRRSVKLPPGGGRAPARRVTVYEASPAIPKRRCWATGSRPPTSARSSQSDFGARTNNSRVWAVPISGGVATGWSIWGVRLGREFSAVTNRRSLVLVAIARSLGGICACVVRFGRNSGFGCCGLVLIGLYVRLFLSLTCA